MKYFKELTDAVETENFQLTDEILSKIKAEDDSIEYVRKLLSYMENNPDIDYGMPGPIVHYMEKYYRNGYEQLLHDSVVRKPTVHTLWMLNRVINGSDKAEKDKYLLSLKEISNNKSLPENVREEAKSFLKHQEGSSKSKAAIVVGSVIAILIVVKLISYWLSLGDMSELDGWYYIDTKGHLVNDQAYYHAECNYNEDGIVFVRHLDYDTTDGKLERVGGFVDSEGYLIGNKTFEDGDIHVLSSSEQVEFPVIYLKSGKIVLLDEHLRQVAELKETYGSNSFGYLSFSQGLGEVSVVVDGIQKWGYINENAEWVIPPQFKTTSPFSEDGIACITDFDTGKVGYITRDGKWLSDERYYRGTSFYGGFALVQREENGPAAYINTDGQYITGFDYEFWPVNWGFSEGLTAVKPYNSDGYYFINENGEKALDTNSLPYGPFKNGLAPIGNENGKVGFIDINGKLVIDYKYDSAESFSDDGYALVKLKDKYGIIDTKGKWLYKPQFSDATTIINGYARVYLDLRQQIRK